MKDGELRAFKTENPSVPKMSASLFIVTKSGFTKIIKMLDEPIALPECYKVQKVQPNKKEEYAVVIGNARIQSIISLIRKELVTVDVLLDKYNRHNICVDDMEALRKTLADVGTELGVDISSLAHERYKTTFEMKI